MEPSRLIVVDIVLHCKSGCTSGSQAGVRRTPQTYVDSNSHISVLPKKTQSDRYQCISNALFETLSKIEYMLRHRNVYVCTFIEKKQTLAGQLGKSYLDEVPQTPSYLIREIMNPKNMRLFPIR